MECLVCERSAQIQKRLCTLHLKALHNIKEAYQTWREAYHNTITLEDYLNEINEQPITGEAAKEVAKKILSGELEWENK